MNNNKWIETKKECELDGEGRYIVKKVTLEIDNRFTKKDIIDISLRIVGIIAIFIPFLLFILQRNAEAERQKALFQLEVYSSITSELHSLLNKQPSSAGFKESEDKLFYVLHPKLVLLNDKAINDQFDEVKKHLAVYTAISLISDDCDSIYKCISTIINRMRRVSNVFSENNFKDDSVAFETYFEKAGFFMASYYGLRSEIANVNSNYFKMRDTAQKYLDETAKTIDTILMHFESISDEVDRTFADFDNFKRTGKRSNHQDLMRTSANVEMLLTHILEPPIHKVSSIEKKYNYFISSIVDKLDRSMINSSTYLSEE